MQEPSLYIAIISGVFFMIILYLYFRRKADFQRSINMVFLRVSIPKKDTQEDEQKEIIKDTKEQISIMEQLLASFYTIYSNRIKAKLWGQDYISLEYIAYNNEILFYLVIPRHTKSLIEKQITSFYTDAVITETEEPNIFSKKNYYKSSFLYTDKHYVYPIKTYQKLETDPINHITNAFSKL